MPAPNAQRSNAPGPLGNLSLGVGSNGKMADEAPPAAGSAPGHNTKKAIDFEGAAALMKTQVANLSEKGAKVRGDQAAVWKRIEEKGVNKKAAKAVQSMLGQSPATVSDYLRTFIGLLNPCGLGIIKDMVDVAEDQTGIMVPLIDTPTVDA